MKLLPLSKFLEGRDWHGISDDFGYFNTDRWAVAGGTSQLVEVVEDGVGGLLGIATDSINNDDVYVQSGEHFKFQDDCPLRFECLMQYSEANTNAANVLLGLMDAPSAGDLGDDGAGLPASYSGCLFYKLDGESFWRFESSVGATQTSTALSHTAGGSAYHRFGILFQPITSTAAEVIPFFDGAQCTDYFDNSPVKHVISFTGATEMAVAFGLKSGGTGNVAESMLVDWVDCNQLRA